MITFKTYCAQPIQGKIIALAFCASIIFSSSALLSSAAATPSNSEQLAKQDMLPPIPVMPKELAQNELLLATERVQHRLFSNVLYGVHQAYRALRHKENEYWQVEAQLQVLKKNKTYAATRADVAKIKAKEQELQQAHNEKQSAYATYSFRTYQIEKQNHPGAILSWSYLEQALKNATWAQACVLANEKHELEQEKQKITAQLAQLAAENRIQSIHTQSLQVQLQQLQKLGAQDAQIAGVPEKNATLQSTDLASSSYNPNQDQADLKSFQVAQTTCAASSNSGPCIFQNSSCNIQPVTRIHYLDGSIVEYPRKIFKQSLHTGLESVEAKFQEAYAEVQNLEAEKKEDQD